MKVRLLPAKALKLKNKQHYRLSLLKRIGIYQVKRKQVESNTGSSNATAELTLITVQVVNERIGSVIKGTNFSGRLAWKILRNTRRLELNWVRMLTGAFDWRLIMIILLAVVAIVGIYILFKPGDVSSLGPPPK